MKRCKRDNLGRFAKHVFGKERHDRINHRFVTICKSCSLHLVETETDRERKRLLRKYYSKALLRCVSSTAILNKHFSMPKGGKIKWRRYGKLSEAV